MIWYCLVPPPQDTTSATPGILRNSRSSTHVCSALRSTRAIVFDSSV